MEEDKGKRRTKRAAVAVETAATASKEQTDFFFTSLFNACVYFLDIQLFGLTMCENKEEKRKKTKAERKGVNRGCRCWLSFFFLFFVVVARCFFFVVLSFLFNSLFHSHSLIAR